MFPGPSANFLILRVLDRDSGGTIGFMEMMLALDLVGANKYAVQSSKNSI